MHFMQMREEERQFVIPQHIALDAHWETGNRREECVAGKLYARGESAPSGGGKGGQKR